MSDLLWIWGFHVSHKQIKPSEYLNVLEQQIES